MKVHKGDDGKSYIIPDSYLREQKENIIKELDNTWHKINNCKMDRVRDNFITKTQVAYYFDELKKHLQDLKGR